MRNISDKQCKLLSVRAEMALAASEEDLRPYIECTTGTHGCRPATRLQLMANLHKYGFEVLGTGLFSVVVAHPLYPGVAMKLGLRKDDSGAAYAAYCRANPGKHIPQLYYVRRCEYAYIVVMKRYRKTCDVCLPKSLLNHPNCHSIYAEVADDWGISIADVLRGIGKHFAGLATFDLHDENVMLDDDDTIIITDPVSWTKTKDYKAY